MTKNDSKSNQFIGKTARCNQQSFPLRKILMTKIRNNGCDLFLEKKGLQLMIDDENVV